MDAAFFDKDKIRFKELELEFEDNDDILANIKDAFNQYNISKGEVIKVEGYIKNFSLNYFQRSSLKNIQIIEPKKIVKAQGEFKYDFINKSLFGRIRIVYENNGKRFDGILLRGRATEGLKIKIRFMEVLE